MALSLRQTILLVCGEPVRDERVNNKESQKLCPRLSRAFRFIVTAFY